MVELNQSEVDLLAELYEEGKTPEEMISAIDQMRGKTFSESVGDAFKKVMQQIQSAEED